MAAIVVAALAAAGSAGADPTAEPTPSATSSAPSSSVASSSVAPSSASPSTSAAPSSSAAPTTSTGGPTTSTSGATPASAGAGAHQVTYTVTTPSDLTANLNLVTADPPSQGAVNDPKYMPLERLPVGPGSPWTLTTSLNDPTKWAFVSASGGLRVNPEFHCEIAVDGQVVTSQQGGSGVQCALRPWN